MKASEIARQIEEVCPLHYQESYDNCGFQVGDPNSDVTGILISLDVTEEVIDEAIQKGCNMIISHHPLIFGGLKKITPSNYVSRCVIKAIENHITIYAGHTNVDKYPKGVSYKLAEKLGLTDVDFLCEEDGYGLGSIGLLKEEKDPVQFLNEIKEMLNVGCIRHTNLPEGKKIKKVALCGGSGHEFLPIAIQKNADIYLTADIKYHQFFDADNRIILADLGHFESEQFTKEIFYEIVSKNNANFAVYFSDSKTNPINYI